MLAFPICKKSTFSVTVCPSCFKITFSSFSLKPSAIPFLQTPGVCERYVHMFSRTVAALTGVSVIPRLGLERAHCRRVAQPGWILHKTQPSLHSKPVRVLCHSAANTSPTCKNIQGCIHTTQSQTRRGSEQIVSLVMLPAASL